MNYSVVQFVGRREKKKNPAVMFFLFKQDSHSDVFLSKIMMRIQNIFS